MNVRPVSRTADGEWRTLLGHEASQDSEGEFALLVTRQSRLVFRIAYAVVRIVEDAQDVTQEVFLKLFRSGAWLRIEDEKAFLAKTVWRLAVSRRPSHGSAIGIESSNIRSGERSPERTAIVNERSRTIHRLIDSLPERLKRPLTLSSIEDMATSEIATVMDMPEGTVRRLIAEARALVKEKMARMEGNKSE